MRRKRRGAGAAGFEGGGGGVGSDGLTVAELVGGAV